MGNCCWTQCFGLLRKEAGRLQRVGGGGGSKYFRTCSRGEHLTIEFENLVESDEGESPGSSHRPLTEEEIIDLRERHYDSIAEKQKDLDKKIQNEQERQRIVQQYHPSNNGEYQSSGPEDDFESCLRNVKSQYEVFRSSRLSSDATVLTPNTESSCDLMTKTKSTSGNDDSTSLDLEWEDEEEISAYQMVNVASELPCGMNRMLPMRERSKTEEDILRAALKYSSKKTGSNPTSASDDSNGLEWENDFVSAEMDDNGNSEYSGFVNPVLELSDSGIRQFDTDQQTR
ncbi:AP-1 complex-associated regulatory protein isoform X3 [Nycticebus coucang]|uniref:AP-1 complex-associated regulatory protein isoform X3 n=1 Tax=Nycticebus coucang TaxID=9470 RepID=UPI00234CC662|nr:AP-1 complex-associated regulatory protein isoform X3 [Nycticebus coucang]